MILIFGQAGSGKSVQGQVLAARYGWRWLSVGQLLRDTKDTEIIKEMNSGDLVKNTTVNNLVSQSLQNGKGVSHLILDGYPRQLEQAEWLVANLPKYDRKIEMVIILEVPQDEIMRRLQLRGRRDDTKDSIKERLDIYSEQIKPIVGYFNKLRIPVIHIDGTGTVGQIHDRIDSELKLCSLV